MAKQKNKKNTVTNKSEEKPNKFNIRNLYPVFYVLIAVVTLSIINNSFGRPKLNRIEHTRYPTDFFLTAQAKIKKMNTWQPKIVCVGHSHLKHALVVHDFIEQTKVPLMKEHLSGSQSSYWYLMLKNVILRSTPQPPVVAIFFAETELTTPKSKVNGHYKQYIDMLADWREPVLDRLAYFDDMDGIEYFLRTKSAFYQKHFTIKTEFENGFKRKIEKTLGLTTHQTDTSIAHVFANENMNSELFGKLQEKVMQANSAYDFDKQIDNSFLPEIIRLANEKGIRLIFVSIPRELDLYPDKFSEEKVRYLADLEQYFQKNSIPYIDIAKNAAKHFTKKAWYDTQHMVYQGESAKEFTTVLVHEMMPYIQNYQADSSIIKQYLALPETQNP